MATIAMRIAGVVDAAVRVTSSLRTAIVQPMAKPAEVRMVLDGRTAHLMPQDASVQLRTSAQASWRSELAARAISLALTTREAPLVIGVGEAL